MSERNYNWGLEKVQIENQTCDCCGEPFQFVTGIVYDEHSIKLAGYFARLQGQGDTRTATLNIGIVVRNPKKPKKELKLHNIAFVLIYAEGELSAMPINPRAANDAVMELASEVVDLVLENDVDIRSFMEEE